MGSLSLRLDDKTVKKLDELSVREGKDRTTLIREILEQGIRSRDINEAVERYRQGNATAWRSSQLAGISLWNFLEELETRGMLIQYGEGALERDLEALRGT